jgi:putative hydrolase of the HAD superfamily
MLTYENSVIVFDLDDTLYEEADYQRSGINVLADLTETLTGEPVGDSIRSYYEAHPQTDVIGFICDLTGFAASFRQTLLWAYRLHEPSICLSPATQELIGFLRRRCHAIAILTDGRAFSQIAKIRALGLDWMPAFISEIWNSEKPDELRFREIEKRWPGRSFIYVGDNPAKDFQAPENRGWTTIGIRNSGRNIHSQYTGEDSKARCVQPQHWIKRLSELQQFFWNPA